MKLFAIIILFLVLGIGIGIFGIYRTIKHYNQTAEKLYREYIEEAKTLDDMAGLLEGLFDIRNPGERHICAHCSHLRYCVVNGVNLTTPESCECFEMRNPCADTRSMRNK